MSEQDIKPVRAGQIKEGFHIIHNDEVYLVRGIEKSKSGKHGHTKCRIKIENIFTGSKTEISIPGDLKLQSPIIDKRNAQVISLGGDSVQLMDLETYDTFESALPPEEDLKSLIQEGSEVEYWNVIGRRKIMRVKSSG
ncbi:MAG: translation initiation factor IF-5A [Candidatus Heimdallarchaeota archaeon]|nr:translation initiation factor IF-5A [Candidatus Heimdallarchaeota archaeon]MCK4768742.1 translation initiation factor IF-5A [Candidatus Heimdallarchaeota archaeon]